MVMLAAVGLLGTSLQRVGVDPHRDTMQVDHLPAQVRADGEGHHHGQGEKHVDQTPAAGERLTPCQDPPERQCDGRPDRAELEVHVTLHQLFGFIGDVGMHVVGTVEARDAGQHRADRAEPEAPAPGDQEVPRAEEEPEQVQAERHR